MNSLWLLGLTASFNLKAGIAARQVVDEIILDGVDDLLALLGGRLSEHLNGTTTIKTADLADARGEIIVSDFSQRDLAAITGSDTQIAQFVERAPVIFWPTQHDAHIIPATWKPLDFFTVIGLSNLIGYGRERQSRGFQRLASAAVGSLQLPSSYCRRY